MMVSKIINFKKIILLIFFLFISNFLPPNTFAAIVSDKLVLSDKNLKIEYDKSNLTLAKKLDSLYNESLNHVTQKLDLKFENEMFIKLCKNKSDFQKVTGINNLDVQGIAISQLNLIVINSENIFTRSQDDIKYLLEHEITHIVLGNNISHSSTNKFPRWLNEGIAQWVSNGSNELLSYSFQTSLQTAFITSNIIPLNNLVDNFPNSQSEFIQAYAQSLSFVEYLSEKYTEKKLILLIHNLKTNNSFNLAFEQTFKINFLQAEQNWIHEKSKSNYTIDYYISTHINSFIEGLIGLIAVFAFTVSYFRNKKLKANYLDQIEEDHEN